MDPDIARRALEAARDETTELIRQMSARLASVVDAASETADDEHDPEGSTLAFERGQLVAQIERSKIRLGEIDEACKRVAQGTYGRCENCGAEIGVARLEALVAARLCITCAASQEDLRQW